MKKKIAVFTTGWCGEILSEFLTGMQTRLEQTPVDVFLFLCYPTYIDSASAKQGELNIYSLPDIKNFDGVVIFGSGLNFNDILDDLITRAKEADVPVILQGAVRPGVHYVGSDNYTATLSMCEHLKSEHDVGSFIFFAGTENSHDSELRLKAVRDFLAERGKSDELKDVFYTNWENAAAERYINKYCGSGKPLPDAIICANDGLAMQTCVTLSENGFTVPDDVIVTGYDYLDDSQIFDPSIASVDQCFKEMGAACGSLWLDIISGKEQTDSLIIPCKFIPGDSCNCYEVRNSDKMRRRIGREAFTKRSQTTYFNRKLNLIDSTILSCLTYQDFKNNLHQLLKDDHFYEGDSFHVLLEPNFGLSIYDPTVRLRNSGYNKYMEVVYSSEDGKIFEDELFTTKNLIPGYSGEGENHLYTFLPLHEEEEAYGYIIFRDLMTQVHNHFLQIYQSRMSLVFDKFRHALSLDLINKRLLEVMRRDPLTNVNNRRAYEDKEKHLQSEINSGTDIRFAIAMFDVNNLKLVNDSRGHEAGDMYLINACHLICNVFKHSPVYRVGGDEFIAILTGEDLDNYGSLFNELNHRMSPYSDTLPLPEDYISIASGVSEYNWETDMSVNDVVKRADERMYHNKAKMKGQISGAM